MNASIFQLYGLTLFASIILSPGLSLLGTQLASKDRAMQTLCMGQGAMLGVLLGLGLSQTVLVLDHSDKYLPLLLAIFCAVLTYFISEALVSKKISSSNTHFASFFAALLSGGYLVSSLFPALENHMAQKYFGDLSTLGSFESIVCLILGAVLILAFIFFARKFTEHSFEVMISGKAQRGIRVPHALDILAIITICTCVQTVGYLFTIACLFIPTAFASRSLKAGLKKHLLFCAVLSSVATGIGFVLSLVASNLPTVPTIIASMIVFGAILKIGLSLFGKTTLLARKI